ncbi:hypothetical protein Agub_g3052, partial [Astrephomene gubernaculifera]
DVQATRATHLCLAVGAGWRRVACMAATKNNIIWFRKGLRLHDNPALLEACKDAAHVYPIFILDPFFLQQSSYKVSVNRYNFLLESLKDLDASFRSRGSRLLVLRGKPEEVLPRVFQEWGVHKLCFEMDTEPYARTRDARVRQLAEEAGVEVHAAVSHTLYDTDMLVARNGGSPPLTMQAFCRLVERVGEPLPPAPDPPAQLPPLPPLPPPATTSGEEGEEQGRQRPSADPAVTGVPTWQEVGFKEAPVTIFRGGETEALRRLDASFSDPSWVASFQKPDTDPAAFERPATTVLSPYLKFGCLSPRLFHARLLAVYRAHPRHSQPPVSLRAQLLWREFFYTVGAHTPNFHRMSGNPLCKQVPWQDDPELLAAWREARTGYPWIDAIMTQLRQWGWVHHLARHSVACFLTRGDLWVSWERGMEVFEEHLIDQDHYLNAGNWMWLSASAFFNAYFRVYSPVSFGKKYDPEGKYIRKFLPVLKDMPSRYIYEPWTAPLAVQRAAGCLVGRDYPAPVVQHAEVSKRNIARMAEAYRANKSSDADPDEATPAAASSAAVTGRGRKSGTSAAATTSAAAAAGAAVSAPSATTSSRRQGQSRSSRQASAQAEPEAAGTSAVGQTRGSAGGRKRQRTIAEALGATTAGKAARGAGE